MRKRRQAGRTPNAGASWRMGPAQCRAAFGVRGACSRFRWKRNMHSSSNATHGHRQLKLALPDCRCITGDMKSILFAGCAFVAVLIFGQPAPSNAAAPEPARGADVKPTSPAPAASPAKRAIDQLTQAYAQLRDGKLDAAKQEFEQLLNRIRVSNPSSRRRARRAKLTACELNHPLDNNAALPTRPEFSPLSNAGNSPIKPLPPSRASASPPFMAGSGGNGHARPPARRSGSKSPIC